MCPTPLGSVIAIRGDAGSGVNVVAMETMRNLCVRYGASAIAGFNADSEFHETNIREWVDKLGVGNFVRAVEGRDRGEIVVTNSGGVVATILPFAKTDAISDAWVVLRRAVMDSGRLPAVDVDESSSRIASDDPETLGRRAASEISRGNRALIEYLGQPFFVAEPWTGKPGEMTGREEMIAAVRHLIQHVG
jgi:F0F1-type ATP synthase beta subunit